MSTPSRASRPTWAAFVPGLVAGVLWLLIAGVRGAFRQIQGGAAQLGTLVPDVVPLGLWGWPGAWTTVGLALSALAIVVCHTLYAQLVARGLLGAWFATVAAGATVGLALDLVDTWDSLAMFGARGLLTGEFGATAAAGALWGLVIGWMPGLIAARIARSSSDTAGAEPPRRRGRLVAAAAAAIVALVAGGLAGEAAERADIAAQVEAQRAIDAQTSFGAPPDPGAQGEPVPETADVASVALEPNWCTPEKATVLKGEPDAATGHRGMPIRLMNFSDEPCVIEGYPDVAFGDQNAHLLDVTVEQGGSFMAQDPGAQRIEVPAGGYAVTYLGWDAASPHGALVTKTVYAAPTAGMVRGSWPIDLDIVEGATVAVTAWAIDPNPFPTN
ncbi:DUF4232 domain-containing protein [Microbacterium sp. NPDC056044]|uniref:DUF4232 domain-containing protein n=1 Tax=Microbacterium sp. NPDC056044 TaxID=3345690 RepID=UPI0035E1EEF7